MSSLPPDIDAMLASLVTVEPRLRTAEVQRVAQEDPEMVILLTTRLNQMEAMATWRPGADEVLLSQRAGTQIGAFTLVRPLGSGGMGEVWLGERRDDGDFVQQVAIKLLLRSGSGRADLIQRFVTERRILSTLNHPNIARLIDGGATSDGEPYYAMEYVEGEALHVYCREQKPDLKTRVRLVLKICEAVAYAQNRLVVHRDLKPGNILVDASGKPHVLDFGIAKVLDEGDAEVTLADARAWTPAYAAPEQMLGEPVSNATDVYSLGVILFQLLTGQLPKARRSGNSGEVLLQLSQSAERPSALVRQASPEFREHWGEVDPQRVARNLKGDLDWIVEIATMRDPTLRYRNAEAMAEDLTRYLDGRPLLTRAAGGYRLRKFLRRYWLACAAALITLSSLSIGLSVALLQASRANAEAARASAETLRATQAAEQAAQTRDFVVSTFRAAGPLSSRQGRALSAAELIDDALARLDRDLPASSQARAELRVVFGSALGEMGRPKDALPALDQALAELVALLGEDHKAVASALQQRALIHGMLGDVQAMSQDVQRALTILGRLPGDHREVEIQIRTSLGKVTSRLGHFEEALQIYQNNLQARSALFGPNDARLAADYNNVSIMLLYLDRYDAAIEAAQRGLELLRSAADSPIARQAWMLNGLGTALLQRGDLDAASKAFEESVQIAEQHVGAKSEPKAIALHGLALIDYERGEFRAAERRWLELEQGQYQDGTGAGGTRLYSYGRMLLELGRVPEAQRALREAVKRMRVFRTAEDPYVLRAEAALALADLRLGDPSAGTRMDSALASAKASTMQLDEWAEIRALAAEAALVRGDKQAAQQLRAEALAIYQALLPANSTRLTRLRARLAPGLAPL